MRIKTITCHDVYNFGASLQAFALVKYLQSLGHDVEVIDYKPPYLSNQFRIWGVTNPAYNKPILREIYQILKLPGRISSRFGKRKREFDRFSKLHLPKTKIRYGSYCQLVENPPEADLYIAGSDQIWNTMFMNGKDPAFYLSFAPESSERISYAASIAVDDIDDCLRDFVKENVMNLDRVSIREETGVRILQSLGVNDIQRVLDPVFLISVSDWSGLITRTEKSEKYVFVYDFENDSKIRQYAEEISEKNGWKIYSALPCKYADKCVHNSGPIDFLKYVFEAQYVVTNSFHAIVFSIIFRKPFAVFERDEAINSRLLDLLEVFDLSSITETYDEDRIANCLEKEIAKSKKFLKEAIFEAERKANEGSTSIGDYSGLPS